MTSVSGTKIGNATLRPIGTHTAPNPAHAKPNNCKAAAGAETARKGTKTNNEARSMNNLRLVTARAACSEAIHKNQQVGCWMNGLNW